ncbi:RICIN domain-containing protein [Streptomyces sp. DSM 15324]|nr:RICIN domain-containing protein [Streptomyces sp. DSM 15324]
MNSGRVLDVPSGGTRLVQTPDTGADSRLWKVVSVD